MNTEAVASERAEADTVTYSIDQGIAWVSFNRPEKRNCMSPKLNRQMEHGIAVGLFIVPHAERTS